MGQTASCCWQTKPPGAEIFEDVNDYLVVKDPNDPIPEDKRKRRVRTRKGSKLKHPEEPENGDPTLAPSSPVSSPASPHESDAKQQISRPIFSIEELGLRKFKAIDYLQKTEWKLDALAKRFQKLGGTISPAVFLTANSQGIFELKLPQPPSPQPPSAQPPSQPQDGASEAAAPRPPASSGSIYLPGDNDVFVMPVCADGQGRAQICYQALQFYQQQQRQATFRLALPHGAMHSVDPFVSPSLSYTQFLLADNPDFDRETAWSYRDPAMASVGANDSLFQAAFGAGRVVRFGENELISEIKDLAAKLKEKDLATVAQCRQRIDELLYQPALVQRKCIFLVFNRALHALLFRLVENAIKSKRMLRQIVLQPVFCPDPILLSNNLNSHTPLVSFRDAMLSTFVLQVAPNNH
eukprot:TRINITY_DN906_c0_g1_i2.p1 TRINITY_DN906_c0_g1~~TRINITY_DN906_c0_g1_i2.p1  ORF type:complete len:409 (-),score=72.12 TRINITY_DN906_c0_g1_i2:153-1379(-)